ncbi:MAG: GIY-YIG nuclease family protein [Blastocatellia bacterium]|nr:GIY-YIG nuclease family protein [Blastocatellia bacterium]
MELFDLDKLPSMPLVERAEFPHCPCVYFVIDEKQVLYVGQCVNLCLRWMSHNKISQLPASARIAWLEELDSGHRHYLEAEAIKRFRPALNQLPGKRNDPDYVQTSFYLPRDLYKQVKLALLVADRDLGDVIDELLEAWLKEQEGRHTQ